MKKINKKWIAVIVTIICILIGGIFYMYHKEDNSFDVKISGTSMMPTLKDGDTGKAYKNGSIKRGDIIVFAKNNVVYVKRVIGLPGETITINNEVYINGEQLDESEYLIESRISTNGSGWEYTLSENEYWVMGDNRHSSVDSRDFGAIKLSDVIGFNFEQ